VVCAERQPVEVVRGVRIQQVQVEVVTIEILVAAAGIAVAARNGQVFACAPAQVPVGIQRCRGIRRARRALEFGDAEVRVVLGAERDCTGKVERIFLLLRARLLCEQSGRNQRNAKQCWQC
jgi:hypothetical protein